MLGCVAVSVDIRVRRGEYYDTIFWDGDCRKIKASFAGFGEEKICICRKRVNTNGKWRELDGTFYQNMGTSPSCLYDYRETGNSMIYLTYFIRRSLLIIYNLWQNMLNFVQ